MAGRKGRSGPPQNLNAVKRSWSVFWRRRALRPEDRWVGAALSGYSDDLVSDRGGPEHATAAERGLIDIATTARGCSMLILAEVRRRGFVRELEGTWDLTPGAKELAKFLGIERSALQALGFERRAKEPKTIEQWLAGDDPDNGEAKRRVEAVDSAGGPRV